MIFLSIVIKKSFVTFLGFSDSQFEAVNVFSAWADDNNIKINLPHVLLLKPKNKSEKKYV